MIEDYNIIADYHTHTTFSHGKDSVRDNVLKARELGLKTIALTDHGLGHFMVGVTKKGLKKQKQEIEDLRKEFDDIEILWGIEGNITGISGAIDVPPDLSSKLDVIVCGFHKPVIPDKLSDLPKLFYNSYSHFLYSPTKGQVARNTKAYINAIKKNPIDIISHINYHLKVDCKEVCKACVDYNTVIEISSRHSNCTEKDYEEIFSSNVLIALNSDAHKVSNIANCKNALEVVNRFKVDSTRIINCESTVFKFRSKE